MLFIATIIKGNMLPMVNESEFVYVKIPKLNQSDEKVHLTYTYRKIDKNKSNQCLSIIVKSFFRILKIYF
jgi:hypothetical protein